MSFQKLLKKAQSDQSVVSVYSDPSDWDSFSVGRIVTVSDEVVVIAALSKLGQQAGFELRQMSEIYRLEVDGQYERKIAALAASGGAYARAATVEFQSKDDPIDIVLRASLQDKVVLTIWGDDDDSSMTGVITGLDEDTVEIALLDTFGVRDGTAHLSKDEIVALDYNGISEQVLRFLSTPQDQS